MYSINTSHDKTSEKPRQTFQIKPWGYAVAQSASLCTRKILRRGKVKTTLSIITLP